MQRLRIPRSRVPGETPWHDRSDPPPGAWMQDAEHWPLPVTPLYADFEFSRHLPVGAATARSIVATLGGRPRHRIVGGFVFGGGTEPTPPATPEQVADVEREVQVDRAAQVLREWPQLRRRLIAALRRHGRTSLLALSTPALRERIYRLSDLVTEIYAYHFGNHFAMGVVLGRFVARWSARLGASDGELVQLLAGSSPASSAPATVLLRLARRVRADVRLLGALSGPRPEAEAGLAACWREYVAAVGDRAVEFELGSPTVGERPQWFFDALRDAVDNQDDAQRRRHQQVAAATAARIDALRSALRGDERERFNADLGLARGGDGVRADDVGLVMWAQGQLRHTLLEAGRRFAAAGLLGEAGDVFYLRWPELDAALLGNAPAGLAATATTRRHEREAHLAGGRIPRFLGTPFPRALPPEGLSNGAKEAAEALAWYVRTWFALSAPPETPLGSLRGTPASAGSYRGPARVVLDESDFGRVQEGDVLVCRSTSPTWSVVFGRVKALVTDVGGVLSHPAIIAREFGIPAVVGTQKATATLMDGQQVTVDGGSGTITF